MKIIVVGGSGTLGQAVVKELAQRHTIVVAAKKHGDVQVDITNIDSIQKMYKNIGEFDALISTVGTVKFAEFSALTSADYQIGLNDKLMGQVNLVVIGQNYVNDGGSFTLTSGILSHDPIRMGTSASMVNGAIDGFVRGAAIELSRGIRINSVSPTVVTESMDKYAAYFRGFQPVSVANVALAFSKSVEGLQTGRVYQVGY